MKLLLDECADARPAPYLREHGHEVALVTVLDPSANDRRVLELAFEQRLVLITTDLDFG